MRRRTVGRFKSALGFITKLLVTWKFYVRPTGQGAAKLLERDRSLSRCALGMALGEAEGGVAAGTEAEGIIEVLKSERDGRRLPLKENEITASAELLAEYVTADEVRSNLGEEDLFEEYADTFAEAGGKERLPPVQKALAKRWWMNGPAPREKEAVEVSSPPEAAAAAAKVKTVDAGTSSADLKIKGMSTTELSTMAEQLRAMGCTADEAIGLSGVILYGKWINRSQRPDIGYGDSVCALKTCRELDKAPNAKTFFTLSKSKDRDALTQFWAQGHQLLVDGGRSHLAMLMLGWMSQMQFQIPDNEIFFAYLGRYITKYEGRGLPTPLDESLLAQVHRTVTKPSATIAKELAAANARSSKLESEVSDLKVQLQQVLLASGGHFANDRFYGKCHWCGQKGHRESDCPAKARGDARI